MSKVKTRNEIKNEMQTLAEQISQAQADHAAQVVNLESTITALTADKTAALAQIEALTALVSARDEELRLAAESSAALVLERDTIATAKAEAQGQLEKAKAALANPAFVDASLIPGAVNQVQADADADKADADAADNAPEPTSELEIYESMPQGADRLAYFQKHKPTIYKQMEEREKGE